MRLASGQSGDATLVVPLSADGTARFRIMSRRVHIRLLGATSGDLQVRAGTLLLRGQDLAALAEIDDTALRFHRIPADLSNIQPGQVVVAALTPTTPQGLLRKVTAVSRSGSDLVLSTIPATLSDVLLKGSIRADQDLNQSNITAFTPLRHGVWLAPLARAAHSNSGFGASFDTDIVPDQPIVSPASIQITGNGIHVNPSIHFSANASLFPPSLKAEFTAGASESLDIHVTGQGGFRDILNFSHELARAFFAPVDVQVGFIPFYFVPEATIGLGVGGNAAASFHAGITQKRSFTYGVGFDTTRNGGPFYVIDRTSRDQLNFDQPQFDGSVDLKAGPSLDLNLLLDYAAGPSVGFGPFARMNADTTANPWWKVCFGVSASVGFDINLLSHDLSYSHDFATYQACPFTAGGPFGVSVTVTNPGNQTGSVGTPASLQIHASDSDGGALTYGASGLPQGLTINDSTGLISGTPTTAGSYPVTVRATDASGPSSTAVFSWTINPAPVSFAQATSYPMPSSENAVRVATGGLAGGTLDDIVTGDSNGNVTVFLNNGDGTFAPGVDYATGGGTVTGIAIADVNGDGKRDVIATTLGSGGAGIFIFLGDGSGGLEAPYSVPDYDGGSGDSPTALAVGNFFHDGRVALATGGSSSGANSDNVRVFSNDGTGHFTLADTIRIGNTYTSTSWLQTADLTDNGSSDIVASAGGNTVTGCGGVIPLINNGSGSFSDAGALPNICSGPKVAAADFNLDGHTDIAAADSCDAGGFCGAAGQVERIYFGAGDGTFPTTEDNSIPAGNPGSAVAADLNGSGRSDLVVACSGSCSAALQVLVNNGDGTFTAGPEPTGDTQDIATGDFTTSCFPSLATVGSDLKVLINTTPGAGSCG